MLLRSLIGHGKWNMDLKEKAKDSSNLVVSRFDFQYFIKIQEVN
jgi:hypothetical protein